NPTGVMYRSEFPSLRMFIRSTRAESDVAQNAGLTQKELGRFLFDEVEQAKVKQESSPDSRGIPLSNFAVETARSAERQQRTGCQPVRRVPTQRRRLKPR